MNELSADFGGAALAARRATGRPTRAEAWQRHEDFLDGALELFLERGFELTTMEGVAAATGVTKRTIYRRYADKKALFLATVQRAIDQWLVPVDELKAVETDDLEATLLAVAHIRVANILSPGGLRLQRIINAESFRFPVIAERYDEGLVPTIDFLAGLFRRHEARGLGNPGDPKVKALAFLSVIGGPTRSAILGRLTDPTVIDALIADGVRLLLHGVCRPARDSS